MKVEAVVSTPPSSGSRIGEEVDWTREKVQAFAEAKAALVGTTMLAHPPLNPPTALTTDASDLRCSHWPFPPKASATARGNPVDLTRSSWLFFCFLLEGREQKPLTFTMTKTVEPWSGR